MPRRTTLSNAELEIARVLWSLGEATPRQVFDAFPNKRKVDFTTVQTYLKRLEAKGYIRARRKGRTKTYRSKVKPESVIRQTVDDFINLVFDGETPPLLHHLIESRRISQEDIQRFREMLDEFESKKDDSARP